MYIKNSYETFALKILEITPETSIDYTFCFEYDKPLIYGQFFELSIPGVGEAPISVSAFDTQKMWMTIRKVGKLTDAIFNCKAGDTIQFRGPYGNGFNVEQFTGSDLIIVAGGTGLAPVRGLTRYFITNKSACKTLNVISGFKSPSDILYHEELEQWERDTSLVLTVDKGTDTWTGNTGLVTEFIPKLTVLKSPDVQAVVVGPPLMMKFATLALIKDGVPLDKITVSFERNMSCGLGKCGHCKIDETYVCLDGPVFSLTKAMHLID
jgi:anaerobic sulfite reductase subunit B